MLHFIFLLISVNFVYLFQEEALFCCFSVFISTEFGVFNFLPSLGLFFLNYPFSKLLRWAPGLQI